MNKERIRAVLRTFEFLGKPRPKQKDIAQILNISERTIRKYWREL